MSKAFCKDDRIAIANRMLECFAPDTTLRLESGHVIVCWNTYASKKYERRWMTRGQDFYPVWSRLWAHGGTACTALSQLVRWVKGKPVLPISTWSYWATERVRLLRLGDWESAIRAMSDAGYPQTAECVLCKNEITGGMDWWSLDGVTGPCCGCTSGCRQQEAARKRA